VRALPWLLLFGACSPASEPAAGSGPAASPRLAFGPAPARSADEVPDPARVGGFGTALASLADLDGDGVDEIVVGAPTGDAREPEADGAGRGTVWLLSGAGGDVLGAWLGPGAGDRFGAALAVADFDGDGREEVAVGAPGARADAGAVYVLRPLEASMAFDAAGSAAGDRFGAALAAGDVDGDGTSDLVVGAPGAAGPDGRTGRVVAFALPERTSILSMALGVDGALFGAALDAAHDLDGDGCDDVCVGAPGDMTSRGQDRAGKVWVLSTGTGGVIAEFEGDKVTDAFGSSVATCDVGGDGKVDFLCSAARPGRAPVVRVHDGETGVRISDVQLEDAAQGAAPALLAIGDVDGDGGGDWAVGMPAYAASGSPLGLVRVLSGRSSSLLWEAGWPGDAGPWSVGAGLARMPDFDGDGAAEVLVGAPDPGAGPGGMLCLSGANGEPLLVLPARERLAPR